MLKTFAEMQKYEESTTVYVHFFMFYVTKILDISYEIHWFIKIASGFHTNRSPKNHKSIKNKSIIGISIMSLKKDIMGIPIILKV